MNVTVPGQMQLTGHAVTCVRGGREVFSGLDFEAASGEAVAVVGRNGSGKTSLLRLIAGLLIPAGGTIVLDGGDADDMPIEVLSLEGAVRMLTGTVKGDNPEVGFRFLPSNKSVRHIQEYLGG